LGINSWLSSRDALNWLHDGISTESWLDNLRFGRPETNAWGSNEFAKGVKITVPSRPGLETEPHKLMLRHQEARGEYVQEDRE